MSAASNTAPILEPPPMPVRATAEVVRHPAVVAHPAAPALAELALRATTADEFTKRAAWKLRQERLALVAAPILGVIAFIATWAAVAQLGSIPGPAKTWLAAVQVFSDPFYRNGPN